MTQAAQRIPIETDAVETPAALQQALDPAWLTGALAGFSGGARVASVEMAELIKTMASKARIVVRFEGKPNDLLHLCLKAFMDEETISISGGATTLREADFYTRIAPHITMRVPGCISVVADRKKQQCILLMPDMIQQGAHFCSALEPFTLDQAAQTIDQIARLHAGAHLLDDNLWIPNRLQSIVDTEYFPATMIQPLMHDARRANFPERTLDAQLLLKGMRALAERNASLPQTLGHGDCHAGNVYLTADGPGFTDWQLIHRGSWALDVAYHICAILTVDVAEREERRLLNHYLDVARLHGAAAPTPEQAWEDYRAAQLYGFYHWAITRRQPPAITNEAFQRLGAGVTRHDTYKLLGL